MLDAGIIPHPLDRDAFCLPRDACWARLRHGLTFFTSIHPVFLRLPGQSGFSGPHSPVGRPAAEPRHQAGLCATGGPGRVYRV
jgi:hypothetical protein